MFVSKLRDAIVEGNFEGVKKSIAEGTNVNAVDDEGQSPLHWAASWGQLDICRTRLLENYSVVDRQDKEGCTPLHEAAKRGHNEIAHILVNDYGADVNA